MKQILFSLLLLITIGASAQKPKTKGPWPHKIDYKDSIILKQNDTLTVKDRNICVWGDPELMELHTNGRIYTFKSDLPDGKYMAFYDYGLEDTAMVVVIKNKNYEGLLQRWDKGNELAEECEYKNGLKHGWRKLYFHTHTEYGVLVTIQKCENGGCAAIHTEW